jgi:amidase
MSVTTGAPPVELAVVPAAELASRVRSGSLSARRCLEDALARIARHDALLGAFTTLRADAARCDAEDVQKRVDAREELPLAGVPIAVKDNVAVAGEVMTSGSQATGRDPQERDHPVVQRLRAAGAVVVGLSAMPEAGLWLTTDGERITRNPWNLDVSPSGSSGGSAAAVASGMVPIAHGNDGLGSVRQPAAACGVLGMKPSHGLVPADIGVNDWYGLAENGPLAQTTTDLALMLSVMSDAPDLARVEPLERTLNVAVSIRPPVQGTRTDPVMTKELFAAAGLLASHGHHVARDQPTYPQRLSLAGTFRWLASATDFVEAAADPDLLEERTLGHAGAGRRVRRLIRHEQLLEWRHRVDAFFERYDLLMTPVTASAPLPADRWSERAWAANIKANVTASGGFCGMWNVAGCPAISIPFGVDATTGTPIGIQVAAPIGSEPLLLSVAQFFERWHPWAVTAPGWS